MRNAIVTGYGDNPSSLYEKHIEAWNDLGNLITSFTKLCPNMRNYDTKEAYNADMVEFKSRINTLKYVKEKMESDLENSKICSHV